jgi:hypothetical protein
MQDMGSMTQNWFTHVIQMRVRAVNRVLVHIIRRVQIGAVELVGRTLAGAARIVTAMSRVASAVVFVLAMS